MPIGKTIQKIRKIVSTEEGQNTLEKKSSQLQKASLAIEKDRAKQYTENQVGNDTYSVSSFNTPLQLDSSTTTHLQPKVELGQASSKKGERFRKPKMPVIRLKEPSKLEGVEVPLLPMSGKIIHITSGDIVLGDEKVRVYCLSEGPWGPLQPLADYPETQEIFIAEKSGLINITTSISGKRFFVELPRELIVERLAQRIAIMSGMRLSEREPQASGEYCGWRVNISLPQLSGGWQIAAARVVRAEPFKENPLLLVRLLALAAMPSSIAFVGPPGSGKTTALIGVLKEMIKLWPHLRVSIVEEEPEVAVQVQGPCVISYFSFAGRKVTDNIRATRRYDRPDILVVGELKGEEVPSWFEAAGSGIPVFTTAHSVTLSDLLRRLDSLIQASGIRGASVIDVVRVWVICGKVIDSLGSVKRGVLAVYTTMPNGLQPIYKPGRYLPEDEFLELLPPELQLSVNDVYDSADVYNSVKEALGATISNIRFEHLDSIPLQEVQGRETF